jgi:hypothetical protein
VCGGYLLESALGSVFRRAERIFRDRGLIVWQTVPVESGCVRGSAYAPVLDRSFVEVMVA